MAHISGISMINTFAYIRQLTCSNSSWFVSESPSKWFLGFSQLLPGIYTQLQVPLSQTYFVEKGSHLFVKHLTFSSSVCSLNQAAALSTTQKVCMLDIWWPVWQIQLVYWPSIDSSDISVGFHKPVQGHLNGCGSVLAFLLSEASCRANWRKPNQSLVKNPEPALKPGHNCWPECSG